MDAPDHDRGDRTGGRAASDGGDAPFRADDRPVFGFHHLGVATGDADATAAVFRSLLGTPVAHEETFEGMTVRFLGLSNGYLELLEPADDVDGPVARHLDRRGPGIHHVAVRTDDLAGAVARAREVGVEMIDDEPRPGAWGHRVAFCHPRSTEGVLLELVDADEDADADADDR
jgi:methylmalonyl-CoA/ethylmalonyl-CoA epimerase